MSRIWSAVWSWFTKRILPWGRSVSKKKYCPAVYASGNTPAGYVCQDCSATGVKLWRDYQSSEPHLRCVDCAGKRYSRACELPFSDQISWSVPAVPDEEGFGYWGYTSVPDPGCEWWHNLPLRSSSPATGYELKKSSSPGEYQRLTEEWHKLRFEDRERERTAKLEL